MNISTLRPGISARSAVRAAALLSALPLAIIGYSTVAVAAAAHMCGGHSATTIVTSHSAHTVRGTSHRDVILIRDTGHVVIAKGGDDLVWVGRPRRRSRRPRRRPPSRKQGP